MKSRARGTRVGPRRRAEAARPRGDPVTVIQTSLTLRGVSVSSTSYGKSVRRRTSGFKRRRARGVAGSSACDDARLPRLIRSVRRTSDDIEMQRGLIIVGVTAIDHASRVWSEQR